MNLTDEAQRQLVVFRLGAQQFCVSIDAVKEIRPWTPATPLPHSPSFVFGVINLRGTVLPVVDLAARLHLPAAPPTERSVIVIVWVGKQLFGLLVDGVCDILAVSAEAFQATPHVGGLSVDPLIDAVVSVNDELLNFIALEHLLPPDEAAVA